MKNNELNNKVNNNFKEGFGMSNEEMNQIVGGYTFFAATDVCACCASVEPTFGNFGEATTDFFVSECAICTNTFAVINTGCQSHKK